METNGIFIHIFILLILIICLYVLYKFSEPYIAKFICIFIFNKFDKGNLTIIGENGNELFSYHNNDSLPHAKIFLKDENNFFHSLYLYGERGLGESYVRGEWSSDDIVSALNSIVMNRYNPYLLKTKLNSSYNKENLVSDKNNIASHYDNEIKFIDDFLYDDLKAYTCGLWFNENDTLNDAQYNKVNTIIKKLNITEPNKKLLDIGCGWGKIAEFVANTTNCHVTGITISEEQVKYANKNYNPEKTKILNLDYRMINEKYDSIYSIGCLEHVRYENYDELFKSVKRCLKPGGRFVFHTIICFEENDKLYNPDHFMYKYIFPGCQIPNNDWILDKSLKNDLKIVHFEGFGGQHYAKTLKSWREKILENKDVLIKKYGEEMFLKYEYYLASCETCFNLGMVGIGHYVLTNDTILTTNNSFNY
jgi:cyclopropane-fatty-acyl-phospholipid synthase